jgi:uncharacterized protein
MPRRVAISPAVVDTSCLICLLHLDLLPKLVLRYDTIYIPRYVWGEVGRKGKSRHRLQRLLSEYPFLKKCHVINEVDARLLYDSELNVLAPIDRGEAEAIIQARERGVSEVLMDEGVDRIIAQRHNLKVKGTLGLLKEFNQMGIVDEIKPLVEKLRKDLNFRISPKLLKQILIEVGEG